VYVQPHRRLLEFPRERTAVRPEIAPGEMSVLVAGDVAPHRHVDIRQQDCIAFLRDLPDESVDVIVTDPAYSGMNQHMKFGHGRIVGRYGEPGNDKWFSEFADDPDTYRRFLDECHRVLRDGRHIYIMFDTFSLLTLGSIGVPAYDAGRRIWVVDIGGLAEPLAAPYLGVGSDDYKKLFCKGDEPIFDCFIPLSLRGRVTASAMSGINRAKRLVKRTPALFQLAQKLRSALR